MRFLVMGEHLGTAADAVVAQAVRNTNGVTVAPRVAENPHFYKHHLQSATPENGQIAGFLPQPPPRRNAANKPPVGRVPTRGGPCIAY